MRSGSMLVAALVAGCLLAAGEPGITVANDSGATAPAAVLAAPRAQPIMRLALTLVGPVPANAIIMRGDAFSGMLVCAPASSTAGSLSTVPRPPVCIGGHTYTYADPRPAGFPIDYQYGLAYCQDSRCERSTGGTIIWRIHFTMPSVSTTYRHTYRFHASPSTDAQPPATPRPLAPGLPALPVLAGVGALLIGLLRPWRAQRVPRA